MNPAAARAISNSRRLIRGLDLVVLLLATGLGHDEPGTRHPNPLDATGQEPLEPVG